MVTDMIALKLLSKPKLRTVDREHIEKVVRELERTASGLIKMTEVERLKKIGELVGADYLLFGSVTEFNTTNMQIKLDRVFGPGEEQRYDKEYKDFVAQVEATQANLNGQIQGMAVAGAFTMGLSQIGIHAAQEQQQKLSDLKSKVYPLEHYQKNIEGTNRLTTVANVGLTAKLIRVSTGKVIWVYQGSKRDMDLRRGMTTLVDGMLESLLRSSSVK